MTLIMKKRLAMHFDTWHPHGLFEGTLKEAHAWCEKKNDHPNNYTTLYCAMRVPKVKR